MAKLEEEMGKFLGTASLREFNTGHTALIKKLNREYAKIQAHLDENQSRDASATSTVTESVLVVGVVNFQFKTTYQCLREMGKKTNDAEKCVFTIVSRKLKENTIKNETIADVEKENNIHL